MFRPDPHLTALTQLSDLLSRDVRTLRPLLRQAFARGGVLGVSHHGTPLLLPFRGVPARGIFELASVTKPFTAALAAALVDAGHLSWDAPLRTRGGPFRALPATITPRTLATHTSGLPAHPARAALTVLTHYHDPYGGLRAPDVLASAARWAPRRAPHRFGYSNLGAGVLALALADTAGEALSADGFARALRTWVTDPLTLPNVSLTPGAPLVLPAGPLGSARTTGFGGLVGAGGLFGNADDLLRFGEAHLDGRAGTHWTAQERPAALPAPMSAVTPGWFVTGAAHWHDGVARGTRTAVGFAAPSGTVVALLARGGETPAGPRDVLPRLLRALLSTA
ncbi:serine hydrolase domain-containing protein [Deinococcus maricopensis]|uniref:Beta-lactamase n=1 Tax=Deinococcus maricopensis (strain DSM 21211 / LMG 22137 / NRRL B-23946 / LB-34) TaxID=709986 RepID=E8U366_DEIML|nr:serine hydrolase domain-containing protein [Deinococcus maricopensis]ADV66011.1 beta-lactamase [Deinococcus maricopensis DSM 21211]